MKYTKLWVIEQSLGAPSNSVWSGLRLLADMTFCVNSWLYQAILTLCHIIVLILC